MPGDPDHAAGAARLGFDALVCLSQDLLLAHGLDGHGHAAEAAARLAVERLPGAAQVRVQWRGPQPGTPDPPLVTIFPLGSAAPGTGASWLAMQEVAGALVRQALGALAAR
jgi:hypothetical protein